MKIKTISYKRTKNLGNYENEVLELTADLEEWEDPGQAIANLQERVNNKLGLSDAVEKLDWLKTELQEEVRYLETQANLARAKWEKVQAFMARLNIPVETVATVDDIPF